MSSVNLDLVRKYNQPGPRYTSYPPATRFAPTTPREAFLDRIRESNLTNAADLSLYFPNLHGRTLAKTPAAAAADTTPVLEGRASVVSVFSSMWAESQAASFTAPDQNPALHELLGANPGRAQLVHVDLRLALDSEDRHVEHLEQFARS